MLNLGMIDLKPYGAFVENTICPLFEEIHKLIEIANESGLEITEENIGAILKKTGRWYLFHTLLETIKAVSITAIICYTIYQVYLWKI